MSGLAIFSGFLEPNILSFCFFHISAYAQWVEQLFKVIPYERDCYEKRTDKTINYE